MRLGKLFTLVAAFALAGATTMLAQGAPPAPTITSITSDDAGTITLIIEELEPYDTGLGYAVFPTFSFYRASGHRENADGFDRLNTWGHGSQDGIFDTIRVDEYSTRGVTITGLRRGEQSFYVQVSYYTSNGLVTSAPSNVVSVNVGGPNEVDGQITISVSVPPAAGVDREYVAAGFAAYPNPATTLVHLSIPGGSSEATVQVFDARGSEVLRRSVEPSGDRCMLDVASLRSGAYYAVVAQGEKRTRVQFNVVR